MWATCSSVRLDGKLEVRNGIENILVNTNYYTNYTRTEAVLMYMCMSVCVCGRMCVVLGLQIIWLAAGIDGHFILPGWVRFMTAAKKEKEDSKWKG